MKKYFILAVLLLLFVPTVASADFADMSGKDEETIRAVKLLNEKKYMNGKTTTEFAPDSSITRAEYTASVLRMIDCLNETKPYYLTDVSKKAWYYYVAGSAVENGIISGYGDGTFKGDEAIPKLQAVIIASRVLSSKTNAGAGDTELAYTDEIPAWAQEYVKTAISGGLVANSGEFGANDTITRGEAAVILAGLYEKIKGNIPGEYTGTTEQKKPPITIVIDPGHGKDSGSMSDEEKSAEGWLWNNDLGQWGEWRHWRPGTAWEDCCGSDGSDNCWYRMENGDRDNEPAINLNNAQSAAKYLADLGYDVRMTRGSNEENPSMTKRLIYCYPNNDVTAVPDADLFICLHANSGGGRGSAYIELSGDYTQKWIPTDYAYKGNILGKYINEEIIAATPMSMYGEGKISGLSDLILFCKSPIPIAYMEIGFYDNEDDYSILTNDYDAIGKSVADGIDKYCNDCLK